MNKSYKFTNNIGGFLNHIKNIKIDEQLLESNLDKLYINKDKFTSLYNYLTTFKKDSSGFINISLILQNITELKNLYESNNINIYNNQLINDDIITELDKKIAFIKKKQEEIGESIDKKKQDKLQEKILDEIKTFFKQQKKIYDELITQYENLKCFYDKKEDNINECIDFDNKNKLNLDNLNFKFHLYEFQKIFEINNITKYALLRQFEGDDSFYVTYKKNYNEADDDVRYFLINDELSLIQIPKPENLKFDDVKYKNTLNSKYFDFVFAKELYIDRYIKNYFIEKIQKPDKDHKYKPLFELLDTLLDKLYRYNKEINQFMYDTPTFHNNLILMLLYLNKINIFYDYFSNDLEKIDTHKFLNDNLIESKKIIAHLYNYSLFHYDNYLNKTHIPDILKTNIDSTYEKFLSELVQLFELFKKIDLLVPLTSKFIITDYIFNIFDNEKSKMYFNFSKRKILEMLFESEAYKTDEKVSEDDINFNTEINKVSSSFKIIKNTPIEVKYENEVYPDCGEETLFNLLNYLLLTVNEQEDNIIFGIEKLPENSELRNFYEKYKDINTLEKKFKTSDNDAQEIKNEFAAILNRKKIQYKKNICEIIPTEENIINLVNILIDKEFKNFEEFVKYFNIKNTIFYDNGIIINDIIKVRLSSGHGHFDYNKKIDLKIKKFVKNKIKFIGIIFELNQYYYDELNRYLERCAF